MTKTTNRLLAVVVAALLVLAIGWAFMKAQSVEKNGKVVISESVLDLGVIPMEKGPVSREVMVTNSSDAALVLHRLSTSCGCTTAEMDMSDMAPGETRTMTVTFDPQVHPDLTGPIVRVVYLQTSDTESPETEIDVQGTVTKETEL